jgi:hypothetical protein
MSASAWPVWSILLGAAGALLAIYLKEAVTVAIQRRTIAWQLFGYLVSWKGQVIRDQYMFTCYNAVDKRVSALRASYSEGTAAFSTQIEQQRESLATVRDTVRKALTDWLTSAEQFDARAAEVLSLLAADGQIGIARRDLMDSK